jgi:hypothetical protein
VLEGIALTAKKRQAIAMALRTVLHANIGEFHRKFLYGFHFVETDDITVWNQSGHRISDERTIVGLV